MELKTDYKKVLSGVVKVNVVSFIAAMLMLYFSSLTLSKFYDLLTDQLFLVVLTMFFAKWHHVLKFPKSSVSDHTLDKKSIFYGFIDTIIITHVCGLFFDQYSLNDEFFHTLFNNSIMGAFYWALVLYFQDLKLGEGCVSFVEKTFSYSKMLYVFAIMNVVVGILLLLITHVSIMPSHPFSNVLFAVVYFQVSFLVFHIVIAKIIDAIWLPNTYSKNSVSLLGLYFGSIFYIYKFDIFDKEIFNIQYTHGSATPLTAALTLIIFWTFFSLLFKFNIIKHTKKK